MSFRDYSLTPAQNTTLGDGTYVGPNMLRNKVRPALQQLMADGREQSNEIDSIGTDALAAVNELLDAQVFTVTSATGQTVTTRTLLAGIASPVNGQVALLTEAGREGLFKYSTANLATQVAADPLQGLYVAPTVDTDGSSGAWVRQLEGAPLAPEMFGAAGNGTTDDTDEVEAAIAVLAAGGGGVLYVPGRYRLTRRIHIHDRIDIVGNGHGFDATQAYPAAYTGSAFIVDAGVAGLLVTTFTDSLDVAAVMADVAGNREFIGAYGSRFFGFLILGMNNGADVPAAIGFEARTLVHVNNVTVFGMGGDGYRLVASSDSPDGFPYGNANGSTFTEAHGVHNGGKGLHVGGRDANGCKFTACNFQDNGDWGTQDDGLLANTYDTCTWSTNNRLLKASATPGIGSVKTTGLVAPHTFPGCYIEPGGGGLTSLTSVCGVIGGQLSAGGVHPAATVNSPFVLYGGQASRNRLQHLNSTGAQTVGFAVGATAANQWGSFGSSDDNATCDRFIFYYGTGWHHLNYNGASNLISFPNAVAAPRAYAPSFPQGIFLGDVGGGPRFFYGAVTAVTYARGDMLKASAPSAGGSPGNVCTTAGTGLSTAVFKAEANLAA